MGLLDQLNEPQRRAVEHTEGPLLILAGAGSGKTRVITYRISHLILEHGVYPEQILAVTFTNKASQEMRDRVDAILDEHGARADADRITVSTFHSFCSRLLRQHAPDLGLDWNYNIYDSDDQLKLVKEVMRQQGRPKDRKEARRLQRYLNAMKNEAMTPRQAHEQAYSKRAEENAEFYDAYQEALRGANCADFGDLILGVLELFRGDRRLADGYSRHWQYIMVDEFQDTNPAQYELLEHLTGTHDNLAVVGDDDQAIYRWRGATVQNILGFEDDFPDAEVVKLEQNYRSTGVILDAANDVIEHNPERRDKKLWTDRDGGDEITVFTGSDDREEASFVAEEITSLVQRGAEYGDFAVFYRVNAQSRQIEEQLQNWGIPYQVIGGVSFYERMEIKDVLAYLKVAINPENEVDFLRVVGTPSRGVGAKTIEKLQRAASVPGIGTLFRAARYAAGQLEPASVGEQPIQPDPMGPQDQEALDELDSLRGRASGGVEDFVEVITSLRDEIAAEEGLADVARFLVERINYFDYLEGYDSDDYEDRQYNVEELIGAMQEFEEDNDDVSLADIGADVETAEASGILATSRVSRLLRAFLDRSALVSSTDEQTDEGAVTLMTVHGAKGLEFPTVFIVGMEDEIFPSVRNDLDPEELFEERRLAYVAITRAEDKLYVTNAKRRMMYGRTRYTDPSRFLLDIDPDRLKVDRRSVSKEVDYRSRSRRRSSFDEFETATKQSYFGDGVDSDLWEFDQSAEMSRGRVGKSVKKKMAEEADDGDFDTSYAQIDYSDVDWSVQDEGGGDKKEPERELHGATVSHSRFGVGEVREVSGQGDSAVLRIYFPTEGVRSVKRKYVKILG
jgi:DNA helicase-2/ATP-dependent DNA helicase PcrA